MNLKIAAAWFALDKLTSEEVIAISSDALDRGMESDSLVQMMIVDPVWGEVEPLFLKAFSELAIPIPSRTQAIQILAQEYCRQIVAGEVSPYEGARQIWWKLSHEPEAGKELLIFIGLASEWEDQPTLRAKYEADILTEAHSLLEREANSCE